MPQGTLAERIRCGGVRHPAFYTPAAVGTELAEGKEHREFNGRTYLLEEAITADYAFVRAWHADEFGNLVLPGLRAQLQPADGDRRATAPSSRRRKSSRSAAFEPEQVHTSGIYVHRIVKIPPGRHPARLRGATSPWPQPPESREALRVREDCV